MVDIERLSGLSMDLEASNREKLQSVFPQCFNDGKLDIDKLLNLCGQYIEPGQEKYKFDWSGKTESYKLAGKRSTGTLRPCREDSVNFDTTKNLYIEGDNLEVLKLLQTAYFRKVKMIYIDPPYNTGNDFVYEDDFKDPIEKYKEITQQTTKSNPETMGRYHTNWLNMMYPRLTVAASLLRDDGVIFISIDDNEVTNLRKLCDEVFGEENFIATISVQVNPRGRNLDRHVAKTHEYIVIYCKNYEEDNTMYGIPKDGKMLDEYNLSDKKGKYRLIGLRNRNQSFNPITRPKLYYPLYVNPINKKVSTVKDDIYTDVVYPDTPDGIKTCWTWSTQKVINENELLTAEKSGEEWRIFRKDYLCDENGEMAKTMPKSLWLEPEMNNDYGRKAVKDLFNNHSVMDFPKPVDMIKKIILSSTLKNNNDIILDFFSGSATTAHAVMQLNKEDNGNRQFIMVQIPFNFDDKAEAFKEGYKNICDMAKDRIKFAGEKLLESIKCEELKVKQQSLLTPNTTHQTLNSLDIGFKVFKLDSSNLVKWDATPTNDEEELKLRFLGMKDSLVAGRTPEDFVFEVMLKLGVPLDFPVKPLKINDKEAFSIGENCLVLVCTDRGQNGITPEDIEAMCEYSPAKIVTSEDAFTDDTALSNAHYILKDRDIEMKLL